MKIRKRATMSVRPKLVMIPLKPRPPNRMRPAVMARKLVEKMARLMDTPMGPTKNQKRHLRKGKRPKNRKTLKRKTDPLKRKATMA